jgi:hypothetical protein
MRHVLGLVLAVALAAAVFFAATWGYLRLLKIPVVNGGASTLPGGGGSLLHDANVLYAFAALAGTALLAGLCVAVRRISPLAAGLPGLVLIAWTIVYGFNVDRAVRYIPYKGDAFGGRAPRRAALHPVPLALDGEPGADREPGEPRVRRARGRDDYPAGQRVGQDRELPDDGERPVRRLIPRGTLAGGGRRPARHAVGLRGELRLLG